MPIKIRYFISFIVCSLLIAARYPPMEDLANLFKGPLLEQYSALNEACLAKNMSEIKTAIDHLRKNVPNCNPMITFIGAFYGLQHSDELKVFMPIDIRSANDFLISLDPCTLNERIYWTIFGIANNRAVLQHAKGLFDKYSGQSRKLMLSLFDLYSICKKNSIDTFLEMCAMYIQQVPLTIELIIDTLQFLIQDTTKSMDAVSKVLSRLSTRQQTLVERVQGAELEQTQKLSLMKVFGTLLTYDQEYFSKYAMSDMDKKQVERQILLKRKQAAEFMFSDNKLLSKVCISLIHLNRVPIINEQQQILGYIPLDLLMQSYCFGGKAWLTFDADNLHSVIGHRLDIALEQKILQTLFPDNPEKYYLIFGPKPELIHCRSKPICITSRVAYQKYKVSTPEPHTNIWSTDPYTSIDKFKIRTIEDCSTIVHFEYSSEQNLPLQKHEDLMIQEQCIILYGRLNNYPRDWNKCAEFIMHVQQEVVKNWPKLEKLHELSTPTPCLVVDLKDITSLCIDIDTIHLAGCLIPVRLVDNNNLTSLIVVTTESLSGRVSCGPCDLQGIERSVLSMQALYKKSY